METIAAPDEIARDLISRARMLKRDARPLTLEIVNPHLSGFEEDLPARLQPRADQILHHLMLSVYRNSASAREFVHVDAMPASVEAQLDAAMNQAFAPHALAHARLVEQIHRALFQNARADALLHMLARLALDHDGVDTDKVQQVRENQAGWPGSDDTDLCAECRQATALAVRV